MADDSPVAVNENAGTILESHIEGAGSAVVGSATPIVDTIGGVLVPAHRQRPPAVMVLMAKQPMAYRMQHY